MNNGPWNDDAMWTPEEEDIRKVPVSLNACPECGSTDIDQSRERCEGDSIYIYMECQASEFVGKDEYRTCATEWVETYTISHVEVIRTEPRDNFD